MNLTDKQIKIMVQVVAGNGQDGNGNIVPLDLDELLTRLDYQPSKESLQFSIRALLKHRLIFKGGPELRRGRLRVLLLPTAAGRSVVTGGASVSFLEPENDFNLTTNEAFSAAAGSFLGNQ